MMERLTERVENCPDPKEIYGVSVKGHDYVAAARRLAEYEDTGMMPEDCAEYKKFEDEVIASGKTFGRLIELLNADRDGRVVVLRMIDDAPAADVAPVVRCEKCEHWDSDPDTYGKDDGPKGKCMKSFETTLADDFCSCGERKEDGGNGYET